MADGLPPAVPPGLPDIFGPSEDVDRIGLDNADDRLQREYFRIDNKSCAGAYKSVCEEKVSLESDTAEHCKAGVRGGTCTKIAINWSIFELEA